VIFLLLAGKDPATLDVFMPWGEAAAEPLTWLVGCGFRPF